MTHPYTYQPIDQYVILNDGDAQLFPIRIDQFDLLRRTYRQYGLPEPTDWPEWDKVDGYGLHPDQQKFKREVIPQRLIELEQGIRNELKPKGKARDLSPVRRELKVIDTFWQRLEENSDKYADEIEWIRTIWYYRLFGKHLFIRGKHTWLPGSYWYFLNFWKLNNNTLPEYRDRDRRWAIGLKYCEHTTETFANIDTATGLPIPEEDGTYLMKDVGKRTIIGPLYSKARRVGDTSRIECDFYEFATRTVQAKVGIQGMSDENAENVFQDHMIFPHLSIPIFFKAIWDSAGGIAPKSSILFDDLDDVSIGLHSKIDHASSSDKAAYDGKFLHRLHLDEAGKFARTDINDVIDVTRYCLTLGAGGNIHGVASCTSTVDYISEASAGENYMRLCDRSHFESRNENGMTNSGYINIFFRAEDGLQGFVGPYGESIVENPTAEQAMHIGETYGARKHIENEIADKRRKKDWEGLARFKRQHPQCFADCFIPNPVKQLFRRDKIEDRISYLKQHPELLPERGNFVWTNGIGSHVIWIPDPEGGRFYLSKRFAQSETNLISTRGGVKTLKHTNRYIAGIDTIGLSKPQGRKSNPAIVVRWRRDYYLDPEEKDNSQVQSDRVICTYNYRPDTVDEFNDDALKCCIFIGAWGFPERNQSNTIDYYRRMGYEGILLHEFDRNTGKAKPEAGYWNGAGKAVDEMLQKMSEDIVNNIDRHYHIDLLEQKLEFGGRKTLTDYDLIAAEVGTFIGNRNPYFEMAGSFSHAWDCAGWVPGCEY